MKDVVRWQVIWLLLILLISSSIFLVYNNQYQDLLNQKKLSLQTSLNEQAQIIDTELKELSTDISFMQSVPAVQEIVNASNSNDGLSRAPEALKRWKQHLAKVFASYIKSHEKVYQIRFVGLADGGKELVRVERHGVEIKFLDGDLLQEKGNRDYFNDIVTSQSNDVYISNVNLNQEMGVIQVPHKPTLRFALKVFTNTGVLFGFIIMNVDAQIIFEKMEANISSDSHLFVTNQDGQLLYDPLFNQAFSFELGNDFRWSNMYLEQGGIGRIAINDEHNSSVDMIGVSTMKEVPLMRGKNALQVRVFTKGEGLKARAIVETFYAFLMLLIGLFIFSVFFWFYRSKARSQTLLEVERAQNTSIIENSQDAIIAVTLEGVITDWNSSASRMFGYERSEAMGQSTEHIILTQETKLEEERIRERIAEGNAVKHYETVRKTKTGLTIDVSISASPIYDISGALIGVSKIIRDISEQKRIAHQLEEFNHTLEQQVLERTVELEQTYTLQSAILSNAAHLIIATDIDGIITMFNPAAEALLGYKAEEVVGKTTPALFHLESEVNERAELFSEELGREIAPGFEVFIAKTKSGYTDNDYEWTYITKSGQRVPVYLSITELKNDYDVVVGYLGMATDITELTLSRKKLEALKEQLSTASKIANIGIWGWNLSTNEVYWNSKMFAIYNIPANEKMDYQRWVYMVVEDDRERALEHFKRLAQGESVGDICFDILLDNGVKKTIHAAGTVEYDPIDDSVNLVGINRDISEQVQYEKALKEAKLSADIANKTKSEFVANMSHEIRTPMNAIIGLLELLRKTDLDTKQRDYVIKSDGAARSLLHILNDILDFSKVEAGKLEIDEHSFNVQELAQNVVTVLSANIGTKKLELVVDIEPAMPAYMTLDSFRLQQIMINLAGNAIKFTPEGVVTLKLSLDSLQDKTLIIEVSDTGIGIPENKQKKIFEAFTQAEASTVRQFGGTGLGLVITKMLVELMGGQISLESEEGCGTCFTVRLPYSDSSNESPFDAINGSLRVLVVDDLPEALEASKHAVETVGWHVTTASSGQEAINLILSAAQHNQPFDLVLMDWLMPDKNGLETAQAIEKLGRETFSGKIMIVTAYANEIDLTETNQKGTIVSSIIQKPLSPSTLVDRYYEVKPMVSRSLEIVESSLEGIHILLAEDNATNQLVAREILTAEGAQVTVVNNGHEAVALLKSQSEQFDVVLMDIQMPIMDGYEASHIIRTELNDNDLPIIAMTANALASDKVAAKDAGMNDHVSKPFNTAILTNVILQQVSRRRNPFTEENANERPDLFSSVVEPRLPEAELAVFNPEKALERLGNKEEIYRAALISYIDDSSSALGRLPSDISQDNLSQVCHEVHSLKGTSLTVGAEKLAELLTLLEQQLKQGHTANYKEMYDKVFEQLQHVLELVQDYIKLHVLQPPSEQMGQVDVDNVKLKQLLELLNGSNMAALKFYDDLRARYQSDILADIESAMAKLDFSEAAMLVSMYLEGR